MQLAEIILRSANGSAVQVGSAVNPGGSQTSHQSPDHAVDGLLTTKWFDSNISSRYSRLELWLAEPADVESVDFYTANDNMRRDPVSWMVGALGHDGWRNCLTVADAEAPTLRRAPCRRRRRYR